MTAEEWKQVEEKLKSFYTFVKLKCDEYVIEITLQRDGPFKNVLMVYINGKIEGEWFEDCEEARRFYQLKTKSLLSANQKKVYKKLPKKMRGELAERAKYHYYTPYWTSFRSLKAHLIKNNTDIQLIG